MDSIGQLTSRIENLAGLVRAAPPSPALRDAFAALRLDEIVASTRLAGARLDLTEVRALLDRGRALGGHRFDDYRLVRGYADAAAWAVQHGTRRGPVTTEDLRTLHRLTVRGISDDAGSWRTRTVPPLADGAIPPPHWMVPFETETYVGRLALDAENPAPLALARAVARLVRLQPFPNANGRVARLLADLLAYRRGLPPIVLDARARRAYAAAVSTAHAGDYRPLARVIGNALARGLERLRDAVEPAEVLRPLAEFGREGSVDRLYKAAQRGRLRVVRRDGRLYTTAAWVAAYVARPSAETV
ncbi:MAG: Fic family protein [Candidatus Eremiobacteraeota bacterium]|nr:Fic family protein [Candidatus Eremiobacteraeota bacterium]